MPEFYYFGTTQDALKHLAEIARAGKFMFVLDKWYSKAPRPVGFRIILPDLEQHIRHGQRLYLWSNDYSRFLPYLGARSRTHLRTIRIKECGPTIEYMPPRILHKEFGDKQRLFSGCLRFEPWFYDRRKSEWYRAPESMTEIYSKLKSLIQKSLRKAYVIRETWRNQMARREVAAVWLTNDALSLIQSAKAEIAHTLAPPSVFSAHADALSALRHLNMSQVEANKE